MSSIKAFYFNKMHILLLSSAEVQAQVWCVLSVIQHAEIVGNAHLHKISIWLIFVEHWFFSHTQKNLIKYHLHVRAVFFDSEDLLTKEKLPVWRELPYHIKCSLDSVSESTFSGCYEVFLWDFFFSKSNSFTEYQVMMLKNYSHHFHLMIPIMLCHFMICWEKQD